MTPLDLSANANAGEKRRLPTDEKGANETTMMRPAKMLKDEDGNAVVLHTRMPIPQKQHKKKRKCCKRQGCDKCARNGSNYCKAHGGGKRCKDPSCDKSAAGSTDYCKAHGGGKRCNDPSCNKSAAGSTDYCVAHGGGKRCKDPSCDKSAVGSTDYCIAHGGGKRCKDQSCEKSAVGSTDYCIAHGGGKRCKNPSCDKSAAGSTDYCKAHGGGKRCKDPNCNKSARGGTDYCIAHGGGKRCEAWCCQALPNPSYAAFRHPYTGAYLCTAAARYMVIREFHEGNADTAETFKRYFGFKKNLVLRAEHVFYHELVKRVPKLTSLRRALDESVLSKLVGKTKSMEDPRPDYFHLCPTTNIGLHGEFDESDGHEENIERLRIIAHHAGCDVSRVYYFRVKARLNTPDALCERVVRKHTVYYRLTKRGQDVLEKVAVYVRQCVSGMIDGQSPPASSCLYIKYF